MSQEIYQIRSRPMKGFVLRTEFVWLEDRFIHRIFVESVAAQKGLGMDELIFESMTSSVDEAWPKSPPLQQLLVESRSSGDVLLGVGQAGTSHWSVSVDSTDAGVLRFDWACRNPGNAGYLGTTYRCLRSESPEIGEKLSNGLRTSWGVQVCATSLNPECLMDWTSQSAEFRYVGERPPTRSTLQWTYSLQLTNSIP